MSEVEEISQGLGKELRGLFVAALALAQIAAQRRAAQVREEAAEVGVAQAQARRRFEVEQRTAAVGIALPGAGMSPQQLATSWAQADVARAHAPEVAELWDNQARAVGVDPEQVRAQWWAEQRSRREDPGADRAAIAGLGADGAAAAVADRERTQDLQEAGGAQRRGDPLDASGDGRTAECHGTANGLRAGGAEDGRVVPASPGAWQEGHPSARLAGKAYGVAPGRGAAPARQRARGGGAAMAAAKQREHGLDR